MSDRDPMPVLRSIAPYLADWASYQAEYRGATGLQLAVARRGEVLVDLAWGHANLETGERLTSEHLFRVASHSKTMTALLVMRFVDDGELRLDDRLGDLVTELADAEVARVTVRELLGHQGGIVRDSSDGDFWQRHRPFPDAAELIEVARSEGAVFEPNERFKYSNIGYGLLGLALERVSGTTYAALAERLIVAPLGLRRTGPEHDDARAAEYAAGHTGRTSYDDGRRVIPHVDTRTLAGATGWYSTALEMTRYGAAHVFGDETVISDASKRLMQREESRIEVRGRLLGRYGLGLDLREIGDRELVGHSGGYPGHITRSWIDPEDGLVVSALTNAIDGPADAIATGVVQLVDLALQAAEEDPDPIPEELRLNGRFANLWGVTDIVDLGGVLHAIQARSPEPALAHQRLVADDGALSTESVPGYGATGEPVQAERGEDGIVRAVRIGPMTAWPIDRYREALASPEPGAQLERMAL